MKLTSSFCCIAILFLCITEARSQIISTIAGNGTLGYSGDNGPAISAQFNYPYGMAIDNAGNLYVTDYNNNVIRKITTAGVITTFAGNGTAGYSGDGGPATLAQLSGPNSLTFDNAGNLYFTDSKNSAIRRISTAGIITTFVQTGLSTPYGIGISNAGDLYYADNSNSVILKVSPAGVISRAAGDGTVGYTGDGGPAVACKLSYPYGLAVDQAGNVYFVDYGNNVVREIDCAGIIHTIAGNSIKGYSGDGGPATAARLNPVGLATDRIGNLYIADFGFHVVRKVNTIGIITTIAGNGTPGYSGDGGPATAAQLNNLYGVVVDNTGNIYISDDSYNVIRKITGTLPPPPQLQPQPMDTTICAGASLSFSANAGTQFNYQWQVNSGSGWTNLNNDNTYAGTNTDVISIGAAPPMLNGYQFRCVISDPCGLLLASLPSGLTVNPPLFAAGISIIDSPAAVCTGDPIRFIATPIHGGDNPQYFWTLNGKSVGGSDSIYLNNSIANGDVVSCQLLSDAYCTFPLQVMSNSIVIQSITVGSSVSIGSSANNICSGTPVNFVATPVNGGNSPSFQWQVNGEKVGTNSNQYTSSSLKDQDVVSCIMTSSVGCTLPVVCANPDTMTVYATPVVFAGNDTIIIGGKSIRLAPTVTGTIASYQWTPSTGLDNPSVANPVASPAHSSTYELEVTTTDGCDGSDKITIEVFYGLHMPNAFTPNNDGKNDVFRIPLSYPVKLNSFSIYNRWGNKVFTTSDVSQGWDGSWNHQLQPSGTYVWEIDYFDIISGKTAHNSGTVVLIR